MFTLWIVDSLLQLQGYHDENFTTRCLPCHIIKYFGYYTESPFYMHISATVQASFRLQKPVSLLIPHIERLEYDISGEVGVPHTKVVLEASLHIDLWIITF